MDAASSRQACLCSPELGLLGGEAWGKTPIHAAGQAAMLGFHLKSGSSERVGPWECDIRGSSGSKHSRVYEVDLRFRGWLGSQTLLCADNRQEVSAVVMRWLV